MIIRAANTDDKQAIVTLLKESLGETSSPKTMDYWDWKHINNPFGVSPVLLAAENGELIGARAFMRWHWQRGEEIFSALRAVDTATHPNHQGRGIFKRLTLQLLEECKANNDHFIFNTPNSQSLPGYLKMNWVAAGKIPVALRVAPGGWLPFKGKPIATPTWDAAIAEQLCDAWNAKHIASGNYFTPKSAAYLYWRYVINPVLKYDWICDSKFFAACYLRKRNRFNELRVSELLVNAGDKSAQKKAAKTIEQMAKHHKAHIISFGTDSVPVLGNWLTKVGSYGPLLTLRQLAIEEREWQQLSDLNNWSVVVGDLELF